jgi:hypothetical protein
MRTALTKHLFLNCYRSGARRSALHLLVTPKRLLQQYRRKAAIGVGRKGPLHRIGRHNSLLRQENSLRRQPLKQGARGLQIRGREAFGEPVINRCKACSRLVMATLAHPQTGNAEGNTQLPE